MSSKFFVTFGSFNLHFRTVQNSRILLLACSTRSVGCFSGAAVRQQCGNRCAALLCVGSKRHQQLWPLFTARTHNWQNNVDRNDKRRKMIPKLVYLHNPWKYFITKLNLLKLRLLWDRNFKEEDFIRGSKQAAIVITNIIRSQNANEIGLYTTPIGFQQITRDMLLSRNDSRLKLVKFEPEHIRKAIPMKVATRKNFGRRYCFIDMLFVGLRNTKDFDSPQEVVEVNDLLRKLDADMQTPFEVLSVPHRIVFAEIFMRFRRDYTPRDSNKSEDKDWSVSFYKILTFDVLNYDPKP